MFRSRRSGLVKRLWKARVADKNEAACSHEMVAKSGAQCPLLGQCIEEETSSVKAVAQAMLKRLKEKQLETLVQAVESHGSENTDCVLLPREQLRLGRRTLIQPHVLCCQLWRWPELTENQDLKRLTCCTSAADDPTSVCCNPYHWSLRVPESPPPYYQATAERVLNRHNVLGRRREEDQVSMEMGGPPTPLRLPDDGSSSSSGRRQFWCHLAYWELRQRVGRLFTVYDHNVNVFQDLPHGDGMCLGLLQTPTELESVQRPRDKIGAGVTLSREPDGLWLYNRSDYPIFVNSPTLDHPSPRTLVVCKVRPGYSLKIFDYELSELLQIADSNSKFTDGPYDPNSIRISFAKGWGENYSRQFITSCPCWIEVLLSVNR